MEWRKQGRRRTSQVPQAKENEGPDWTKEELTVYSNGMLALFAAVIKQWKKDGSPSADALVISQYQKILEEYNE